MVVVVVAVGLAHFVDLAVFSTMVDVTQHNGEIHNAHNLYFSIFGTALSVRTDFYRL